MLVRDGRRPKINCIAGCKQRGKVMGCFPWVVSAGQLASTPYGVARKYAALRAFVLFSLLALGGTASAAVVSYAGPTYGVTTYDYCGNSSCQYVNPLPNIANYDYWFPDQGYSLAVSVTSPASESGVGMRLEGTNATTYDDSIISYTGRIYTFQVDEPIFFNALNGSSFVRTSSVSYDSGFTAGWRLCAGATSQTMCAASATSGLSWESPITPGNGTFTSAGPYVQLAPGTYSVWAYLGHSYPQGGPEFGGSPLESTTGTFNVNVSLSSVPIPAAAWLFGSALGLLGWFRRRLAA
jgi:hypothetical protein